MSCSLTGKITSFFLVCALAYTARRDQVRSDSSETTSDFAELKACCNESSRCSQQQPHDLQAVASILSASEGQAYAGRSAAPGWGRGGAVGPHGLGRIDLHVFRLLEFPFVSSPLSCTSVPLCIWSFLSLQGSEKKDESGLPRLSVWNVFFRSPLTSFFFSLNYSRQFCFL